MGFVAVRVRYVELSQAASLIHGSGVNGRLRPLRRMKFPSAKSLIPLINVIHIHALQGSKHTIASVPRELELSAVLD